MRWVSVAKRTIWGELFDKLRSPLRLNPPGMNWSMNQGNILLFNISENVLFCFVFFVFPCFYPDSNLIRVVKTTKRLQFIRQMTAHSKLFFDMCQAFNHLIAYQKKNAQDYNVLLLVGINASCSDPLGANRSRVVHMQLTMLPHWKLCRPSSTRRMSIRVHQVCLLNVSSRSYCTKCI